MCSEVMFMLIRGFDRGIDFATSSLALRAASLRSAVQNCWRNFVEPSARVLIPDMFVLIRGGERGIRTLGTLLTYTHFPGVRLQPLGHLSKIRLRRLNYNDCLCKSKNDGCIGLICLKIHFTAQMR